MNPAERLHLLEEAVLHLREHSVGAGLVVEGRHDVEALESLGIGGQHVVVHKGHGLEDRIDRIVERAHVEQWQRVILLLDWDRTGGRLMERFRLGLSGRVPLDVDCRRRLARASLAHCVEDVPADLAGLRRLSRP